MVAAVPSLEGSFFLTDPQSIIAYVIRKYFRTPADTIPLLSDLIISLPYQVARFGKNPDNLVGNVQKDLQGVLSRIFGTDRSVTVSVTSVPVGSDGYDVNITVTYTIVTGEVNQTGTTISLSKGRLVIPEDSIRAALALL